MGSKVKLLELIGYLSGLIMWNDQMWFIVELAILYVIFYLCFRKRKSEKSALIKMAVCILLMNVISLLLGHDGLPDTKGLWFFGEWWYNTTWMLSHVGYWLEYPGHPGYLEKLSTFLVQGTMVIVFDLTFVLLTMKVQFKNKVLAFLGVIALEMYLLQNIFITKLTHIINNDALFFVAVYACTILLAFFVHKLNQLIIRRMSKK